MSEDSCKGCIAFLTPKGPKLLQDASLVYFQATPNNGNSCDSSGEMRELRFKNPWSLQILGSK